MDKDEEQVERHAKVMQTANKLYTQLVANHGPEEAIQVMAFMIAGMASLTTSVNKHSKHLGYEKNLEAILGYVSKTAKNTKVVLVGTPQ